MSYYGFSILILCDFIISTYAIIALWWLHIDNSWYLVFNEKSFPIMSMIPTVHEYISSWDIWWIVKKSNHFNCCFIVIVVCMHKPGQSLLVLASSGLVNCYIQWDAVACEIFIYITCISLLATNKLVVFVTIYRYCYQYRFEITAPYLTIRERLNNTWWHNLPKCACPNFSIHFNTRSDWYSQCRTIYHIHFTKGVQHYPHQGLVNLFENYVNQSTSIHAIHEYTSSMDAVIYNVH